MTRTHAYIAIIAAAAALTACNHDEYTGEVIEDDPNIYQTEPMPVMINLGDSPYETATKGNGAFGDLAELDPLDSAVWREAVFYVYSFSKEPGSDLRTRWSDAGNDGDICLIDATRHDLDSARLDMGKAAKLNTSDYKLLEWRDNPDSTVYYNTRDYYRSYDFFVYHIGDAEVSSVDRQSDHIDIRLQIDGSQDLLGGKAALTDGQKAMIASKEQGDEIMANHYSTFSANHEVNPYVQLDHYLTKVRFELYPGGDLKDERDSSACFESYIRRVEIDSQTAATMTVATNDEAAWPLQLTFDEGTSRLVLKERYLTDDGKISDKDSHGNDSIPVKRLDFHEEDMDKDDPYERIPQPLGGHLLIAPTNVMTVRISMYNDRSDNDDLQGDENMPPLHLYPPEGAAMFEAGKSYVVKLAIYGYQQIEAQIGIEPWITGEDHKEEIDPDDMINGY